MDLKRDGSSKRSEYQEVAVWLQMYLLGHLRARLFSGD